MDAPDDKHSTEKKLLPSSPKQPRECLCECELEADKLEDAPRKPGVATICQAVESVGGQRVGCGNKVEEFKYRRATPSGPKILLCPHHVERLRSHHLCPFSNTFCAHVSLRPILAGR